MISRFLLLDYFFNKKNAFINLQNFFNNTQIFYPLYSTLYTVKLGLRDCVRFFENNFRKLGMCSQLACGLPWACT